MCGSLCCNVLLRLRPDGGYRKVELEEQSMGQTWYSKVNGYVRSSAHQIVHNFYLGTYFL
jgi:hypothetical protein